jgi:WD40 repeat protein/energy-coupling factor transporter ATP-binding protein EcfA2
VVPCIDDRSRKLVSTARRATDVARVFISHSSKDAEASRKIFDWLHDQGFDAPFLDFDARFGLRLGADWEKQLYHEIKRSDALVLVLTPSWLASKWCFAEFVQGRSLGKPIFPVIMSPIGDAIFASDIQKLDLLTEEQGGLERLSRELQQIVWERRGNVDFPAGRPPYPGLLSFDEVDAAVYFGRDKEILDVLALLRAQYTRGEAKAIVILGASGSGKSSLLRAGIIPRLRKDPKAWIVLPTIRPQRAPVDQLAMSLAVALAAPERCSAMSSALQSDSAAALRSAVQDLRVTTAALEGRIVVPIDQAEELFSLSEPDQAEAFGKAIGAMTEPGSAWVPLLSMRSDYLEKLQIAARGRFEFGQYLLDPFPVTRIPDIIEGPARVVNLQVESALVSAAMRDATTEYALPLLAFSLRELYDRYGDDGKLTLDEYESLGDRSLQLTPLENAVRAAADRIIEGNSAKSNAAEALDGLRNAFVPFLVRVSDTGDYVRKPAVWDHLPAAAQPLLEQLVDARLLVSRQEGKTRIIEVAHEALLRKWPLVKSWLDEEREFLLGKQQLERDLDEWRKVDAEHKSAALLRGLKLTKAAEWRRTHARQLSEEEQEFIRASEELARKELEAIEAQRRKVARFQMLVATVSVVAAIVVSGLAFGFYQQWQIAESRERESRAMLLASRSSQALTNKDVIEAVSLAREAVNIVSTPETRSALLQSILSVSSRLRVSLRLDKPFPTKVAWSPDAAVVLIGRQDGSIQAWAPHADDRALDKLSTVAAGEPKLNPRYTSIIALVSTDKDEFAAIDNDGRLTIRGPGGTPSKRSRLIEGPSAVSVSADLTRIAVLSDEDGILLFDCKDSASRGWETPCRKNVVARGYGDAIAITGDGRTVAFASDGKLLVQDPTKEGSGIVVGTTRNPNARFNQIAWNPTGHWLAASAVDTGANGDDRLLVLFDGKQLDHGIPTGTRPISALAWSPSGDRLAVACDTFTICIWQMPSMAASPDDAAHGAGAKLAMRLVGHRSEINSIAWSPTGDEIASSDTSGTVDLWQTSSFDRTTFTLWTDSSRPLRELSVSANGRWLAASGEDGSVAVWDTGDFAFAGSVELGSDKILSVSWHPTAEQFVAADEAGNVAVVTWPDRSIVHRRHFDQGVNVARWTGEGDKIALAGRDGGMTLWPLRGFERAREGGEPKILPGPPHSEQAQGLAVDRSSNRLLSTDADGEVLAWSTTSGESRRFEEYRSPGGQPVARDVLVLLHDNRFVGAAGNDCNLVLYDLGSGKLHGAIEVLTGPRCRDPAGSGMIVADAAADSESNMLAVVDNDQLLHFWSMSKQENTLHPHVASARILFDEYDRSGSAPSSDVKDLRKIVWLPSLGAVAISTARGEVKVVSVREAEWLKRAKNVISPQ